MSENKRRQFRLIGHPLGQSISPQIHERLMKLSGVDGEYKLFEIEPAELEKLAGYLRTLSGFNVTIPYKRDIVPYLQSVSPRAQRCGAVNTVKCENGEMHGYNTDSIGFLRSLSDAGIELRGKVLLCGAGGVARMMACEVLERGCSLVIATRRLEGALSAKRDLEKIFSGADIEARELGSIDSGFDLILNGTPAGMYPHEDDCPIDPAVAGKSAAVFDTIYNPVETVLVKAAKAAGARAAGGLSMLVWQAAAAQEIWNGTHFKAEDIKALTDDMKELLYSRYGGRR
ncbi:MAG: shikimate dehydrogenase [[Clostridium] cellulosi]|jgi:shikimate 5-dehydrogenase|nr:MAG: shikimate dehydrogenase [[Clostridium] cellulosi]